mmetsp:Transcript_119219/g.380030  ORF Transcript_119219/g.380030 Transcript_119219/m.380030 type:complete len:223 (+) Transcript_119219:216-884(+)
MCPRGPSRRRSNLWVRVRTPAPQGTRPDKAPAASASGARPRCSRATPIGAIPREVLAEDSNARLRRAPLGHPLRGDFRGGWEARGPSPQGARRASRAGAPCPAGTQTRTEGTAISPLQQRQLPHRRIPASGSRNWGGNTCCPERCTRGRPGAWAARPDGHARDEVGSHQCAALSRSSLRTRTSRHPAHDWRPATSLPISLHHRSRQGRRHQQHRLPADGALS